MTLIAELRQSQLAALKLPKVGVATAAVSDTFPWQQIITSAHKSSLNGKNTLGGRDSSEECVMIAY